MEGVHLKNSKKHMKPGVGGLGGLSQHRGLGKQELVMEPRNSQCVSCGQAAQERGGSTCMHKCAIPAPSHSLQGQFLHLSNGLIMV